MPQTTSTYGSWKSPITTDLIVGESVGLGQISLDGNDIYWVEMRPSEGGRNVVVRLGPDGTATDVTPAPFNARTRVHEYGGGAYAVARGMVFFTNFSDQRVYRQVGVEQPVPVTPEGGLRHADFEVDAKRSRLVCVQEDHSGNGEAANSIVSIPLFETSFDGVVVPEALVAGCDFYSSPRLSTDGSRLCWLSWNHPNMPWDGTELWVGELDADGRVGERAMVAGGPGESVAHPAGVVSRRASVFRIRPERGGGNLYRWSSGTETECILAMEAEFARPQWVFGANCYGFVCPESAICAVNRGGVWGLLEVDLETGDWWEVDTPGYSAMGRSDLRVASPYVFFEAGGPTKPNALLRLDLEMRSVDELRASNPSAVDSGYLSAPETIEFPTENGLTAHAFFYPPVNRDFTGPEGEKPPLLLKSHGGPTGATSNALDLGIQFWTSRGFAVVDVNYGGSTGYGREYRQRLEGNWGIVDVDDCIKAARHLVREGLVDESRLAIDGGERGRVHDTGGTDVSGSVFGGGELLRGERPGNAGTGHAQVRVQVPWTRWWGRIQRRRRYTGKGLQSTSRNGCRGRSSCCRGWRTGSCRRTRR